MTKVIVIILALFSFSLHAAKKDNKALDKMAKDLLACLKKNNERAALKLFATKKDFLKIVMAEKKDNSKKKKDWIAELHKTYKSEYTTPYSDSFKSLISKTKENKNLFENAQFFKAKYLIDNSKGLPGTEIKLYFTSDAKTYRIKIKRVVKISKFK
ncbi:MAG: hypothetical protein HRT89_02535 [Lentisphaeria bacterium]|nr:hypothetical protein [Lentisphaeria bacterium]NQZ66926.1 hypothetical protein [Lentisphaeria bacterium]